MTTPSYEDLIAYAAGELSPEQAAIVASSVTNDPRAAAIVMAWQMAREALRQDDGVEPSSAAITRARAIFAQRTAISAPADRVATWIENAQRFIARLVYDSRLQPAAVRFGGEDDRINLTFETESGEIDLQAERLPEEEKGQRWRLMGQISGATGSALEIALAQRGSSVPVMLAATDEHGGFALETDPGDYDLLIRVNDDADGDRVTVLSPLEFPR